MKPKKNWDHTKKKLFRNVGIGISLLTIIVVIMIVNYHKNAGIRFVEQMGAGINLGNSLDVKGVKEKQEDATIEEYETFWHNPPIRLEHFKKIKEGGLQTVRIPVSFGEHMTKEGVVDKAFLDRVEDVVRQALSQDLYVILDTHHEAWLIPSVEKEAEVTEKLCFLWEQIASRFHDVGEKLLLEGMNEPRVVGSDKEWSGGEKETREVVNRLNEAFVQTIRNSGGENKERYLVLTTYGGNYKEEAITELMLPKDKHIIVAVHAYVPYSFALNENGKNTFSKDNLEDTEPILTLMENLNKRFIKNKIPVLITEFGCIEKENLNDRIAWTDYYVTQARMQGIGLVWWDDGKKFQLLDRNTGEWVYPQILEKLKEKRSTK